MTWGYVIKGEEELGVQKRCSRCDSFWPLDATFWPRNGTGWYTYCRACNAERCATQKRRRKAA